MRISLSNATATARQARLRACAGVIPGVAGCGKLVLHTDAPPAAVHALRSVQCVLAFVCQSHSARGDVPYGRDGPAAVGSLVRAAAPALDAAVRLWATHRRAAVRKSGSRGDAAAPATLLALGRGDPCQAPLRVRGSGMRDGCGHAYRSPDLGAAVGGALLERFRAWRVGLQEFDIEVAPCARSRSALLALRRPGAASVVQARGLTNSHRAACCRPGGGDRRGTARRGGPDPRPERQLQQRRRPAQRAASTAG